MDHIKVQTQIADATADMLRASALMVTRAAGLSASRSVSLWALLLANSAPAPWALQGWVAWNRACFAPTEEGPGEGAREALAGPQVQDSAFASYRSAGGHAVAQVIVG